MLSRTTRALLALVVMSAGCSRQAQQTPPEAARPAPRTTRAIPAPIPATAPITANAVAFADEVVARTNSERRAAKLVPLTKSVNLMRAAQIQAAQMARTGVLEHVVPGTEYPTLANRLNAVQYLMRAAGENIGEGYRSPAAAVGGWMASSGHRANIMSKNYTEIGTAVAVGARGGVYWVQVFGRPR